MGKDVPVEVELGGIEVDVRAGGAGRVLALGHLLLARPSNIPETAWSAGPLLVGLRHAVDVFDDVHGVLYGALGGVVSVILHCVDRLQRMCVCVCVCVCVCEGM